MQIKIYIWCEKYKKKSSESLITLYVILAKKSNHSNWGNEENKSICVNRMNKRRLVIDLQISNWCWEITSGVNALIIASG